MNSSTVKYNFDVKKMKGSSLHFCSS